MKKVVSNVLVLSLAFCVLSFRPVYGLNMESSRYRIQYGNVNIGADNIDVDGGNRLSLTLGQLTAEEFSRNGYIIKAGFQYFHSIVPFTFSISKTQINLGTLTPNAFFTDTANLRVSFGGAGNYQVTAVEEGLLSTSTGRSIADTGCDDGCDETTAKAWTSASSYGFGYKMANEDIPSIFTTCGETCYRRFPDSTAEPPESPAVIMSNNDVTVDLESKPKDIIHESTITFRANISPVQEAGTYQTIVKFVATPSY
jgi:hypothetical protein